MGRYEGRYVFLVRSCVLITLIKCLVTAAKNGARISFEICGGMMISERYVITTSHCIAEGKKPLNLKTHNVFVLFGQLVCPARKEVIFYICYILLHSVSSTQRPSSLPFHLPFLRHEDITHRQSTASLVKI